ncbi:hypothetical protein SBRCBS47491_003954 [Sporothrix bragantina]|uniref:LysM domain-containing protein n=1 Tax=Sporothrix bragantina TaxID=671064 RepID=A0ABP0BJC8_9PEZI
MNRASSFAAVAALAVAPMLASAVAVSAAVVSAPAVVPSVGLAIMARTVNCIFEITADANQTCEEFSSSWGLSLTQFEALNPTLDCTQDIPEDTECCVIGSVSGGSSSGTGTGTTVAPNRSKTTVSITIATGGPSSFTTSFSTVPSVWPTTTTTSTSATSTSSSKTSTATNGAPSPTQVGQTSSCNNYYLVAKGDTCLTIEGKYGLNDADFKAWNPALDSYCLGLLTGYYVCVGVPGATTTYTQTSTTTTKATTTTAPTTVAVTTTTTSLAVVGTATGIPSPLQPGTFSNCSEYHLIVVGDSCTNIQSGAGISAAEFFAWNSGVSTDCTNIYLGDYLCVAGGGATTGPPSPLQPGTLSNCTGYHLVVSGDQCGTIESNAGISSAQFLAWNSGVNADCTNIEIGYYVCIAGGSGVVSSIPSPLQPGTEDDCTGYHLIVAGDQCGTIESNAGITSAQFLAWNTGVNADCTNIEVGYYVCIAGGTNAVSTVPSPLMPGTEDDCTGYHLIASGDQCGTIESNAGITSAQFLAWNTGVNADCTNIQVGYYVCIAGGTNAVSSTPSPLQPGTLSTCSQYHLIVSGDQCGTIESNAGITSAQFLAWNTGVNADCTNIEVGYYVCIAD